MKPVGFLDTHATRPFDKIMNPGGFDVIITITIWWRLAG